MVKPVAWCNEHGTFVIGKDCPTDFMNSWKPLYTAPKELSDDLPSPVLQEYFEKGYKCAMESLHLSDEEKEKAKTRILANPDVEQSHLTSNEIISQPVAWMENDSLLKWLIPVYPPTGTKLYTAPRELSAKESYDKACINGEDKDPIERLRFYCSLAMVGQDWLDSEPFFDAIKSAPRELSDEEIMDICIMGSFYDRISDPFYDKKTGAWSNGEYKALKELNDEEILELINDSTIFEYREFNDDMVRFARAILKKAREK